MAPQVADDLTTTDLSDYDEGDPIWVNLVRSTIEEDEDPTPVGPHWYRTCHYYCRGSRRTCNSPSTF